MIAKIIFNLDFYEYKQAWKAKLEGALSFKFIFMIVKNSVLSKLL